jgi:hypothetical protein
MKNKLIIFAVIISFLVSALVLAWSEKNQTDENIGKNWWSLYLSDPKSTNLNFVIENHSNENNFRWVVLSNKNKIEEKDATIEKGTALNLNPVINPDDYKNKKITIRVILGNETREIYKNL